MARQSKKSRNELDMILEQLKKSYGADSDNSLEDDLLESPKSDEDAELSEILGRIFSSEEYEKQPTSTQESERPVAEETSDLIEQANEVDDASVVSVESALDAIAEDTETILEIENASEESTDIDAVDNVLNIMFSGKAKNGKAELGGKAVESIIEDTVPAESTGIPIENTVTEISSESAIVNIEDDEECDEDSFEQVSFEELEEIEEIALIEEIEEAATSDEEDTLFAVEDEEYSTDEELEIVADEPVDEIIEDEPEVPEYEPISLPHIILTRAEYTQDPLQHGFPTLTSLSPSIKKIQENPIPREVSAGKPEELEGANKEDIFDENDISLLLNIGYDQEIKAKVGEKKAQQIKLESDNSFTPDPTKKVFGFCGKELTCRKQISEIKEKYKTDQRNIIALLSVVSVLSLMLLYITFSFEFYTDKVTNFPIFLLMDFGLVLLIMTVLYKKLVSGINKLIKLETSPNTLLFFIAIAYALYTIFSLIAYAVAGSSVTPKGLMLFGFAVSIYAVLSLVSDLLNCIRERRTFNIIGSTDTLYTAERSDLKGESNYKIRKTKLISGYFRKTAQNDDLAIKPMYLIGIVPVISLALGLTVYFLSSSISLCVSVVMLSLLFCIPIPFVFTSTLIRFILLNPKADKKSAYIGNSAPEEISRATCLTFNDSDCIEILGYTEINPSTKGATKDALNIAHEIFNALGGPLATIEGNSQSRGGRRSHSVIINQITDDGIDIYYDSSVNVLLGDKHYMQSHNIKVKTDTNLLAATKGSDKSVIFMAFDGVPKLGFIVNSRITPGFMTTSEALIKSGIKVCVRSYEPQINNLYFEQNKGHFMSSINVIKPDAYESSDAADICDGCVVSASDCFELAQAMAQSRNISEHLKINRLVNVGVLIFGILMSIIVAALSVYGTLIFDGFSTLTSHLTTVFNVLMAASLIPTIFEIVAIFKAKKH